MRVSCAKSGLWAATMVAKLIPWGAKRTFAQAASNHALVEEASCAVTHHPFAHVSLSLLELSAKRYN